MNLLNNHLFEQAFYKNMKYIFRKRGKTDQILLVFDVPREKISRSFKLFEECAAQELDEKAYQIYIERCQKILIKGIATDRLEGWEVKRKYTA